MCGVNFGMNCCVWRRPSIKCVADARWSAALLSTKEDRILYDCCKDTGGIVLRYCASSLKKPTKGKNGLKKLQIDAKMLQNDYKLKPITTVLFFGGIMKRLLSVILTLLIIATVIPSSLVVANAAQKVSTGNSYIDSYVNLAISLEGKTRSYFGFNRAWCDLFIGWLGKKLDYDFIPPQSKCSYGYGIGNWIAKNGGTFTYFYSDAASNATYGKKMNEADYTPQVGDIVFLRSSSYSSMKSPTRWAHNGIVYKVTDSSIYVVHGNWSSKVVVGTVFSRTSAKKQGSKYYRVTGYARPAWPTDGQNDTDDLAQISLNTTDMTIPMGLTGQLEATLSVQPSDDTAITYQSGDASIASVDDKGLVTPVSIGETEIIVSTGEMTATAKITVTDRLENLTDSLPEGAGDGDWSTIDLYRYVFNGEKISETEIEGENYIRTEVSAEHGSWGDEIDTTTKPTESATLKITATTTEYNRQKWVANTDITVYSDPEMTEKAGIISSGEQFETFERGYSANKLSAKTDLGYITVRTASDANAYADFVGCDFVGGETWTTLCAMNVRLSASTTASISTTYAKGKSVTVTEYAETDKYLWGKTAKGWIALYNYAEAEFNANQTDNGSVTTYRYREFAGKTVFVYLQRESEGEWQVAPLNAVGTVAVEKATFYYGQALADDKNEDQPEIDQPETDQPETDDNLTTDGPDSSPEILPDNDVVIGGVNNGAANGGNVSGSDNGANDSTNNGTSGVFDYNDDGVADSADMLIMEQAMLGKQTSSAKIDLNGDGVFNTTDLIIMQMKLLGWA